MQIFTSVEEAFEWFLENSCKNLPPDEKKGELTATCSRILPGGNGIAQAPLPTCRSLYEY